MASMISTCSIYVFWVTIVRSWLRSGYCRQPDSTAYLKIVGEAGVVRDPLVWEDSKFCVATDVLRDFGKEGTNKTIRQVISGLFQIAHSAAVVNGVSASL